MNDITLDVRTHTHTYIGDKKTCVNSWLVLEAKKKNTIYWNQMNDYCVFDANQRTVS